MWAQAGRRVYSNRNAFCHHISLTCREQSTEVRDEVQVGLKVHGEEEVDNVGLRFADDTAATDKIERYL